MAHAGGPARRRSADAAPTPTGRPQAGQVHSAPGRPADAASSSREARNGYPPREGEPAPVCILPSLCVSSGKTGDGSRRRPGNGNCSTLTLPLDERGNRALVGSYGNLAGSRRRRLPAARTGNRAGGSERQLGEGSGGGSLAAIACRAGQDLPWVPFYRELRGTGLKARISGTSSARHDVAFGQLPTSPWMSGARQMAVVV